MAFNAESIYPQEGVKKRKRANVGYDYKIIDVNEEKLTLTLAPLDDLFKQRSEIPLSMPHVSVDWGIMLVPEKEDIVSCVHFGDEFKNAPRVLTYRPRIAIESEKESDSSTKIKKKVTRLIRNIKQGEIFLRSKYQAHFYLDYKGRAILSSSDDRDVTQPGINARGTEDDISKRIPDCVMILGKNSGDKDPYFIGQEEFDKEVENENEEIMRKQNAYEFAIFTKSGGLIAIDKHGNAIIGGPSAQNNITGLDKFSTIGLSKTENIGASKNLNVGEDVNITIGKIDEITPESTLKNLSSAFKKNKPEIKIPFDIFKRGSLFQRILKTKEEAIGGIHTFAIGETNFLNTEVEVDSPSSKVQPQLYSGSQKGLITKVQSLAIGKGIKVIVGSKLPDTISKLSTDIENFYDLEVKGTSRIQFKHPISSLKMDKKGVYINSSKEIRSAVKSSKITVDLQSIKGNAKTIEMNAKSNIDLIVSSTSFKMQSSQSEWKTNGNVVINAQTITIKASRINII